MIGPILEEVISWITDHDLSSQSVIQQSQSSLSSQTQSESGGGGGLIGLLAG